MYNTQRESEWKLFKGFILPLSPEKSPTKNTSIRFPGRICPCCYSISLSASSVAGNGGIEPKAKFFFLKLTFEYQNPGCNFQLLKGRTLNALQNSINKKKHLSFYSLFLFILINRKNRLHTRFNTWDHTIEAQNNCRSLHGIYSRW